MQFWLQYFLHIKYKNTIKNWRKIRDGSKKSYHTRVVVMEN